MKVLIGIILIIILLLFLPLKIKSKVVYNFFSNFGYVSVFFFSVRLFLGKIKFTPFKIEVSSSKKKENIYLYDIKKRNNLGDAFIENLIKKAKISSIKFYSNFGFNGDYYISCLFASVLKIFSNILVCILSQKKKLKNVEISNFQNSNNTQFLTCFSFSSTINLFIIVQCLILSFFINFKSVRRI